MEQWFVHCKKADFAEISRRFSISPMLARIIRNRDVVNPEDIDKYLNATAEELYDPMLLMGIHEGTSLLAQTVREGGKIRVIGDYDVDGVCSSYILKKYIKEAGGIVDVRLPDRMLEGYGMNESMAEEAKADGISLIITCDNGISSVEAVKLARELGINVIVTDHHEPPEQLPEANVIIDPKQKGCTYPFHEICGAAVAYKFVQALDIHMKLNLSELLDELLLFAGIATIADIVPLLDENRIFASEAIQRLKITDNPGLNALMRVKCVDKNNVNTGSIGFILGPCINSAGRLKNAQIALNLLEAQDPFEAENIARELSDLNENRKSLTLSQTKKALSILDNSKELDKVIVLYLPDAHESVAGIIAGRIKDEFNHPTIVVTRSEDGLKGSGRSTDLYNMIDSLREHEDLFIKCGGHAKACGFSLQMLGSPEETISNFSSRINAACTLTEKELVKNIWIDMVLPFKYINEPFIRELERLEPFGMNNEKPVFAQRDVRVISASIQGKKNNLIKMIMEDSEGSRVEGILFYDETKITEVFEEISKAEKISILFYPDINEFMGRKTPQAKIISFKA